MTTTKRTNWQNFIAEPVATRSSKPDSVAKEIEEKRAIQAEQAQFWPITSTVQSCVLIDQHGNEVYRNNVKQGFDAVEGEVSFNTLAMIHAANTSNRGQFEEDASMHDIGVNLYGLKIRSRMSVLVLDALRYVTQQRQAGLTVDEVPVGLWAHKPFAPAPWCDPYEVLVPSDHRANFTWDIVAEYLGMPPSIVVADIDSDAAMQAEVARQLAMRAGLFGF